MVTFEEIQGIEEDAINQHTPFMDRIKQFRMSAVKTIQTAR